VDIPRIAHPRERETPPPKPIQLHGSGRVRTRPPSRSDADHRPIDGKTPIADWATGASLSPELDGESAGEYYGGTSLK